MTNDASDRTDAPGFGPGQVLAIALGCAVLGAGLTFWGLRTWMFPTRFEPVELSVREERVLDAKLRRLGVTPPSRAEAPRDARTPVAGRGREPAAGVAPATPLEPEPYFEDPASREVSITERELNALLAHETNLAERFAIDLSDDLASAKLLVPVAPDVPVLGGRILRVHAGVELRFAEARPIVILRGVSLMGVPLPSAWLADLKHVDLVERFGGRDGFWSAFAAGVEEVRVREGELHLVLRE